VCAWTFNVVCRMPVIFFLTFLFILARTLSIL
jgi:hypothetical protein